MAQDYFGGNPVAYDANMEQLITGAVFQVFLPDDSGFSTPLTVLDTVTGAPLSPLRSNAVGILPEFRVTGDPTQVLLKSGTFVTLLTSRFGDLRDGGYDAELLTQAVAAAPIATEAAAAAVAAAETVETQVPTLVTEAIAADGTIAAAGAAAAEAAMDAEIAGRDLVEGRAFFPPDAAGGFIGENGRATDLLVDDEGRVIPAVMAEWATRVRDVEGLIPSRSSVVWSGFGGENDRITELVVDEHGDVPADILARWVARMPLPPASVTEFDILSGPDILTIGDSLTASGTIAAKLATLTGRTVRNMGVGGETVPPILARLGVWPFLMSPAGMVIPASGSVDVTFASAYHTPGVNNWPLLQGTGVREGDTFLYGTVKGVRVRLSIRVKDPAQDYPLHGAADVYQLTRVTAGAEVPLARPEPFLPEFGSARSGDIIIAWMGQNGPTDDATFAGFQSIEQWATKAGKRFLFMTKPTGSNTGWTDFEKKMQDRWGRRYCNVRRFLIDDAMPLMGLTPTSTDLADIAAGTVPTQLRTDATHHTTAAQNAIGEWLLYPRLTELEMI